MPTEDSQKNDATGNPSNALNVRASRSDNLASRVLMSKTLGSKRPSNMMSLAASAGTKKSADSAALKTASRKNRRVLFAGVRRDQLVEHLKGCILNDPFGDPC